MEHGFHIGNRRCYFTLPIGYASQLPNEEGLLVLVMIWKKGHQHILLFGMKITGTTFLMGNPELLIKNFNVLNLCPTYYTFGNLLQGHHQMKIQRGKYCSIIYNNEKLEVA